MAAPDTLFLLVHFRNAAEVERFIRQLFALATGEGRQVGIAVADNSGDWNPPAELVDRVTVAVSQVNLGYLTGCAHAYAAWRQRYSRVPRWVAVVNTDLTIAPGWTEWLDRAARVRDAGIVAPDIQLESGIHQNPHLWRRPPRAGFWLDLVMHRYRALYRLPLWLHAAKQRAYTVRQRGVGARGDSGTDSGTGIPIYAPHGSAMFLSAEFFRRGGTLVYGCRIYGEEIFVAEQVRRLGLQVLWYPGFHVTHHQHAVTSTTTREWRRLRQVESLEYLWTTFFSSSAGGELPPAVTRGTRTMGENE